MLKEYFKVNELSLLFVSEGKEELKEHLIDELDYILLPKEGWEKIVESYGITEGQVQILFCFQTNIVHKNNIFSEDMYIHYKLEDIV